MFILRESRGGAERQEETESQAGSIHALNPEPDAGLKPTNREIMTWAEVRRQLTEPPRHPLILSLDG